MTQNLDVISRSAAASKPSRTVNILAWVILLFPAGWKIYLAAHRRIRRSK